MRHLRSVPDPVEQEPKPEPDFPVDRSIIRMTDRLYDIGHVDLAHHVLDATKLWDQVITTALTELNKDAETARIMANEKAWAHTYSDSQ